MLLYAVQLLQYDTQCLARIGRLSLVYCMNISENWLKINDGHKLVHGPWVQEGMVKMIVL